MGRARRPSSWGARGRIRGQARSPARSGRKAVVRDEGAAVAVHDPALGDGDVFTFHHVGGGATHAVEAYRWHLLPPTVAPPRRSAGVAQGRGRGPPSAPPWLGRASVGA